MAGIEKILERIESEAVTLEREILEQAEQNRKQILEDLKSEAEFERAAALERARDDADKSRERIVAGEKMNSRKRELAAKQQMIDLAFEKAGERLTALVGEPFAKTVAAMAARALTTGREEICFSRADFEKLPADFAGTLKAACAAQGVSFEGKILCDEQIRASGFVVRDGAIETNCTFDALLRQHREALTPVVAKTLF
ncbi:V-type ATP synthase subunit E family protein [Feifania hominis]|uniref:V-type proton ATPase subunit E n=1 Tax=Feifania hominis TaxID=2763660 RepID=A0A926DDX7_9FIRM|nr:hypothetical protein [Feifania hominis]